jgi:hypothetical protein
VAIASFIISSLVSFVLLIVAVRSLQISLVALKAANTAGQRQEDANAEQLAALKAARQAIIITAGQQQEILTKSGEALEKQLRTAQQQARVTQKMLETAKQQQVVLTQQLETMRSQTAVLTQQWNKENEHPAILVLTLTHIPTEAKYAAIQMLPSAELSTQFRSANGPPFQIPISVRNVGNATLRRPKVTAHVEAPAHLRCTYYRGYMLSTDKPCEIPDVELPDLAPDTNTEAYPNFTIRPSDLNFFVFFTVPNGVDYVVIHFTVFADNLTSATYSVSALIR